MDERIIRAHALEAVVMDRIAELWGYRAWYRSHVGWLPQDQVEHRAELHYLIALVRKSRRLAAPAVERADPITSYHDWQANYTETFA